MCIIIPFQSLDLRQNPPLQFGNWLSYLPIQLVPDCPVSVKHCLVTLYFIMYAHCWHLIYRLSLDILIGLVISWLSNHANL